MTQDADPERTTGEQVLPPEAAGVVNALIELDERMYHDDFEVLLLRQGWTLTAVNLFSSIQRYLRSASQDTRSHSQTVPRPGMRFLVIPPFVGYYER